MSRKPQSSLAIAALAVLAILVAGHAFADAQAPSGAAETVEQSAPRGPGRGRGPGPEMRADQEVFHYLLERHAKIRRTVKRIDNGVETLTESDDPAVAAKLQEHVASMHERVKTGRGLRFWDDLFVALFKNYKQIRMEVENTEKGVRVRETGETPAVVALIQAHADVVSLFVKQGFDEAHKNHPVPVSENRPDETSKLQFPIIRKFGGVAPRPTAVEQPRAGAKVVLDVTADGPPANINKGLDRAARLINLYGASGLKSSDVKIVVVLHGAATRAALRDADHRRRFEGPNPNLELIAALREAGVDVLVCGQALNYQGYADAEVAEGVSVAAAALTVVVNKQADGYSYVPVP